MIGTGLPLLVPKKNGNVPFFLADFTGLALGDMSAAAFLSATGLTFTRASDGSTVQTSDATIVTGLTGNDRPRIGQHLSSSASRGLVFEEQRTNEWTNGQAGGNRDLNLYGSNVNQGSGTFVGTSYTAADGTTISNNRWQLASGEYTNYCHPGALNAKYSKCSAWVRSGTGSPSNYQFVAQDNNVPKASVASGSVGSAWTRVELDFFDGAASVFFAGDARDWSSFPHGIVAGSEDIVCDLMQVEMANMPQGAAPLDSFSTEVIVTATIPVTRAPEHLYVATGSSLVDAGKLSLELKFIAKGSSHSRSNRPGAGPGNYFLWSDPGSGDFATIDRDSQTLQFSIGGNGFTLTGNTLSWAAKDTVEFFIAAGGAGGTTAAYRVNGGATVQLGTNGGTWPVAPAGNLDLLCRGNLDQMTSWVQTIAAWSSGKKPAWA